MAERLKRMALRHVQTLYSVGTIGGLTDRQLLDRFTSRHPQAAELAFAVLVERHGAMVLRVCREVLRDHHDAQDAFQATFLVLVRRARSLWVKDSLGPWLHQVAYRTASCARSAAIRRRCHEGRAALVRADRKAGAEEWDDTSAVIHEELSGLPVRYQQALVLCLLEGLAPAQAAQRLGWPVGTVQSRLARGRHCLQRRLIRRGLVPSGSVLAAIASPGMAALDVPPGLADSVVLGAVRFLAGDTVVPSVSAPAIALTEGVLRMMYLTRLKIVVSMLMALAVGAGGGTVVSSQAPGGNAANERSEKRATANSEPPAARAAPGQPDERPATQPEWLRTELDSLALQLKRKQVELHKALAQRELALAVVATHQRLISRRPGMVPSEEVRKAETDVKVADAQVELAQLAVKEAEVRLEQAKRLEGNPQQLSQYLSRISSDPAALDERLRAVERKLDQILKVIDPSKLENPIGDFAPRKR
jgi:RNA polymerase sigma factor (sigma-70 family)